MNYLIWSIEHNAWWAKNRCGYTMEKSKAGRYELEEAWEICLSANRHLNKPNESVVPLQPGD